MFTLSASNIFVFPLCHLEWDPGQPDLVGVVVGGHKSHEGGLELDGL